MLALQYRPFRWLLAAVSVVLALWVYLKNLYYHSCTFQMDLFSHLDMSRSWLYGHRLLYETRYGEHSKLHNYYLTPLLAPFTATLGALGLFIAHALLILISVYALLRQFQDARGRRFYVAVFIAAFLTGPYAFWVWHNPVYGWHVELLFLPMGILFGLSLMQGRRWLMIFTGALLVALREDGCVIACCVHLFMFFSSRSSDDRAVSRNTLLTAALIAAAWSLVFGAGMWFLAHKNDFQNTRFGQAFPSLLEAPWSQTRTYLKAMGEETVRMLAPFALFVLMFFRFRHLIFIVMLTIPLLAISFVASLHYYGPTYSETYYGLTWNTRFSMIMGFQLSCMVFLLWKENVSFLVPAFPTRPIYLVCSILLVALQHYTLKAVRQFDPIQDYVERISQRPEREIKTLKCLAEVIPRSTYLTVPYHYYVLFEWHKFMWLEHDAGPNREGISNAPVKEPDVIIYEHEETTELKLVQEEHYIKDSVGSFKVWYKPAMNLDLGRCK